MTRAIVDRVDLHGIRGAVGSQGLVRARQILRPRLSLASGEAELAPKVLVRVPSYYASY
jgi:hypothetical protein